MQIHVDAIIGHFWHIMGLSDISRRGAEDAELLFEALRTSREV
jgi:hypothetical protein